MIDAQQILSELLSPPLHNAAKLVETWKIDVADYRWDEPLTVEVFEKFRGGYYARATRPELRELHTEGRDTFEVFTNFIRKFKLEPKYWKK